MGYRSGVLVGWVLVFIPLVTRADFRSDLQAAAPALQVVMPKAGELLNQGRFEESVALVAGAFPADKRTPAQSFVLANLLFRLEPKTSYALHKQVAKAMPDDPEVLYEWALEQHRAGEYAGALASYAKFSQAHPQMAIAYGLAAECLIRLGKNKEAVAMWQKSEAAPTGSLLDLEQIVCEVHNRVTPDRTRADLLAQAKKGDLKAARGLIALDCNFERDWWNRGPNVAYLTNDLAVLRQTKFADEARLKELLAAGDCALASAKEENVPEALKKSGYLVDPAGTLPQDGEMLSIMLGDAIAADAIKRAEARAKWGQAILEKAKAAKDAEMFNVAASLYGETEQAQGIDRQAWEATGDIRFAASLLLGQERDGQLKLDDKLLAEATRKYPDNALLAGIVVRLTAKAGTPLETALVNAIKAEYTRFSPNSHQVGLDLPRPGAELLARYFAALGKSLAAK